MTLDDRAFPVAAAVKASNDLPPAITASPSLPTTENIIFSFNPHFAD